MNLPTPVLIAGAALCLLAGYLVGVVAGPDTRDRTTGIVESYNSTTNEICLTGETVADQEGADDDTLCGIWKRSSGSPRPAKGDNFRFISEREATAPGDGGSDDEARVLIYGDVVD